MYLTSASNVKWNKLVSKYIDYDYSKTIIS